MPTLSVVFDTNAYLALGESRFDALRERERSLGIVALAAEHAMLEKAFAESLFKHVVCSLSPEAKTWSDVAASSPERG